MVKIRHGYWDSGSGCYIVGDENYIDFSSGIGYEYEAKALIQMPRNDTRCRFCDTLVFEGERRCVACGAPL